MTWCEKSGHREVQVGWSRTTTSTRARRSDLSQRPRRIEPEAIDAMSQALSEEACKALHTNGQA